jgi:hypothetical protein
MQLVGLIAQIKGNVSHEIDEILHQLRDKCLEQGHKFYKNLELSRRQKVTRINFHVEDAKILGFTVQNLVVVATRDQDCVHPWRGSYDLYLLRKCWWSLH